MAGSIVLVKELETFAVWRSCAGSSACTAGAIPDIEEDNKMEETKVEQMVGKKVVHRLMMTGPDAHYLGTLVNGSRMLDFFGDVATELLVRADGDLSLFLGYEEVRFTAPVHVGDFMEYYGWIEKKGNTSYKVKFEAYKVITMPDDFKKASNFLDGADGKDMKGLNQSAALVLDPPVLCGYATGTLVIPKDCQRGPQDPAFAE